MPKAQPHGEPITLEAAGREIEITKPDKPLYPSDGITKLDVAEYYLAVAPHMIPHLEDRALTIERFPNGIEAKGFYQKSASSHFPDWIRTVEVPKKKGTVLHPICDDAAGLVYLANQGALTFHIWTSRVAALNSPDHVIIDFDPWEDDFEPARTGARMAREILQDAGLVPFLKTTGSKGLHVVCPIEPPEDFGPAAALAGRVAAILLEREPDLFTTEITKDDRGGRLLVDYYRTGWATHNVTPYSLRPKAGAPVSTPLSWDELDTPELHGARFTLHTVRERLADGIDPWRTYFDSARPVGRAIEALGA